MTEASTKADGRLAAVTGASGHIGANLVRLLLEKGYRVRALVHRNREALQDLPLETVPADVLDPDSLERAFRGAEVVFHLAGFISILQADAERLEQINVGGTRNVVAACKRAGVRRLVMTCSIEALLQEGVGSEVSEESPVEERRLLSAYAVSKHRAAREALSARGPELEVIVTYPTAVVGPWDARPSLLGRAIIDFAHRRLPCLVPGGFDFVDARDVAAGLVAAAEKGKSGHGYILSGEHTTLGRMAEILQEHTGARRPRFTLPLSLARGLARLAAPFYRLTGRPARFTPQSVRLLANSARVSRRKAEAELGYRPRPAAEAFGAAVDWYRQRDRLRRVFFSRRDPLPVAAVVLALLVCFTGGLFGLFAGRGLDRWLGLGAMVSGIGYLLISLPVRYEVDRSKLLVRAGVLHWEIPLADIQRVEPTRLFVGAPAWSWDRLKVTYRKNGRSRALLISPAERAAFLACLPETVSERSG